MLDGDKRLFTMARFTAMTFDKASKDLRERHLLMSEQDKVSRLEFTAKGRHDRVRTRRRILADPEAARQCAPMDRKWKKWCAKHAKRCCDPDAPENAARLRRGAPLATIKLTDPAGDEDAGNPQGQGRLLREIEHPGRGSTKPTRICATAWTRRWKTSATRSSSTSASAIRPASNFKDGAKSASLRKVERRLEVGRQGDGLDRRSELDRQAARSCRLEVRRLGFTTPTIEITVVSNDGKTTEKVQIAPVGRQLPRTA